MPLLKAGDVIVANPNSRTKRSYWLMDRDETDDDWKRSERNSHWVGGIIPPGFERDLRTSWDHRVVEHQQAKVIPFDRWPTSIYVMVAKWRLTQ